MEIKTYSEEELNSFPKEMVTSLFLMQNNSLILLSQQCEQLIGQNDKQSKQLEEQSKKIESLLGQIENLQESLAILTNYRFGRKTEKTSEMIDGQISLALQDGKLILNEMEQILDEDPEPEMSEEELLEKIKERLKKRKRKPGVRNNDISMADVNVYHYTIPEDKLKELFPNGYREMKEKVTRTLEYTPAKLVVHEEHIHQYKSLKGDKFVMADHPQHLMSHSLASESLISKVFCDKFVYAVPINRISKEFRWMDVVLRPQTVSRWMIDITDKYLVRVVKRMESKMKSSAKLIHCDETPFVCLEDRKKEGRTKNSKSFMWVYHTADQYGSPPIFIYDYKDNRRTENVENFLNDYTGVIMADGYEPYHIVARKSNGDIVVAGCWAHVKRKFAEIIKVDPKNSIGTVAFEANYKIAKIYKVDNKMKHADPEERLAYRKEKVEPLVNELFEWAKDRVGKTGTLHTVEALNYLINQEAYLREFLNSGIIPLDNSDAERSIRAFCVGKHNWHIAATSRGAKCSGMLYSLAETIKANGLKPYEYFKFLLEQLKINESKLTDEFIDSLLPWSETLPNEVKAKK